MANNRYENAAVIGAVVNQSAIPPLHGGDHIGDLQPLFKAVVTRL